MASGWAGSAARQQLRARHRPHGLIADDQRHLLARIAQRAQPLQRCLRGSLAHNPVVGVKTALKVTGQRLHDSRVLIDDEEDRLGDRLGHGRTSHSTVTGQRLHTRSAPTRPACADPTATDADCPDGCRALAARREPRHEEAYRVAGYARQRRCRVCPPEPLRTADLGHLFRVAVSDRRAVGSGLPESGVWLARLAAGPIRRDCCRPAPVTGGTGDVSSDGMDRVPARLPRGR